LAKRTATLLVNSISKNTQKSYDSGTKQYVKYCNEVQINSKDAFPPSIHVLMAFASWLHSQKLKYVTIKLYLASLKHFTISIGSNTEAFSSPRLKQILRGIRRLNKPIKRERLPITIWILQNMINQLDQQNKIHQDIGAALIIGFFGIKIK